MDCKSCARFLPRCIRLRNPSRFDAPYVYQFFIQFLHFSSKHSCVHFNVTSWEGILSQRCWCQTRSRELLDRYWDTWVLSFQILDFISQILDYFHRVKVCVGLGQFHRVGLVSRAHLSAVQGFVVDARATTSTSQGGGQGQPILHLLLGSWALRVLPWAYQPELNARNYQKWIQFQFANLNFQLIFRLFFRLEW